MSRLLFRLRGVPEDELQDIMELLASRQLSTYETSAGNWGFSFPGLWLEDEDRYDEARQLIDDYQEKRRIRLRAEWQDQKAAGLQPTFMETLLAKPLTTLALVLFCLVIVYFSVTPFLDFLGTSE